MSDHLNDDAVEALFAGQAQHEPLGQLLASIADRYASIPPPPPGPDLAAFMSDAPVDGGVVDRSIARRRRRRVVAAALTGTVLGKVVIGVSVAAASVAGMQASGIVHLPGLPGPHHGAVGPSAPPTTAASTTTTATTSIEPDFTQQLPARDAGTVVVAVVDDEFLWVRPVAAAGWTHTLEQQPTTALVTFQDGAGAVIVDATIEGGILHVVVLDQRDGSSDEYWFDGDGRPTEDPNPPAAPAPVPDAVTPPAPAPVDEPDEVRTVDDDHDVDDDHHDGDHDDEVDDRDHDEVDDRDERDDDDVDDRERRSSDDATSGALRVDDDTRTDDRDDNDERDDEVDD